MADLQLGFIGAGRMATALARGLLAADLAAPTKLVASDPEPDALRRFASETGAQVSSQNVDVAARSDVLFLAVKPQQMPPVLAELNGRLTSKQLVISVAAGVTLSAISSGLGTGPRLVRVMPNTPCLIGRGASAYAIGPGATAADGRLVGRLLSSVGRAFQVEERLLDAVTGLSGSGPAFVYIMIEALSDGGVRMGLPREIATQLAAQTVLGAAEMVLSTGEHPGRLKDQVASPGGTTIAGLQAMELGGVRGALMAAVEAATLRSVELGQSK